MIEPITGKVRECFDSCIAFSRRYLDLPDNIELYTEICPSDRFPVENNAAESNGNTVCFNKQWLNPRFDSHMEDVEFFLFHELRHLYQYRQIGFLEARRPDKYRESILDIREWRDEFKNYVRNVDETSQDVNLQQKVEKDANAYALLLVMLYNKKTEIALSLPESARLQAEHDIQQYKNRKEFRNLIH